MHDITQNIIATDASLKAAMERLDLGVGGVLFCVDAGGVMKGLLTDGDVRRAFLKGADLSSAVEDVMNRRFVKGDVDAPRERNLQLLNSVYGMFLL